jgi:hypothetical protein
VLSAPDDGSPIGRADDRRDSLHYADVDHAFVPAAG